MTYSMRLNALLAQRPRLCVGIDPHPQILQQWGLSVDVAGLEQCSRAVVAALGESAAVFKPQSACFEAFGSAGIAVLERVLADIAAIGALSILDVKRGDIGSTMERYADAYLSDSSPLAADAITVSPYLGFESLRPALDRAHETGRGVYVLARTSNPEGAQVQLADIDGHSVAQELVTAARWENAATGDDAVGLVIGGTHDDLGLDLTGFTGSILVPGIGAQGGSMASLGTLFGGASGQVLASASREILQAGPDADQLRSRFEGLAHG